VDRKLILLIAVFHADGSAGAVARHRAVAPRCRALPFLSMVAMLAAGAMVISDRRKDHTANFAN